MKIRKVVRRVAQLLDLKPEQILAVGNALANNPFPLIVPCHRAIRSDRHPGGYQGGLEMKRALLEKEGIHFDATGRVAYAQFHYERIMSKVSSRRADACG